MGEKDFKVGDECYISTGYGKGTLRAVKIIKITPSGQIVVSDSATRFRSNGIGIGGDTWNRAHLSHRLPHLKRQYAEQVCEFYLRNGLIKLLSDASIEEVTRIFRAAYNSTKSVNEGASL